MVEFTPETEVSCRIKLGGFEICWGLSKYYALFYSFQPTNTSDLEEWNVSTSCSSAAQQMRDMQ